MQTWQIVIIWCVVIYVFFGNFINGFLVPPKKKQKKELKEQCKFLKKSLHRDFDIADEMAIKRTQNAINQIQEALDSNDDDQIKKIYNKFGKFEPNLPSCISNNAKSFVDLLFFLIFLAFGVRALYVQAFKIPTGSMQPTLYGIHYTHDNEGAETPIWKKPFRLINESKIYANQVIRKTGSWEGCMQTTPSAGILPGKLANLIMTESLVFIANESYRLPGTPDDLRRINPKINMAMAGEKVVFEEGETLFNGYRQIGDHLFVNRFYLSYFEPQRGDILVFDTNNLAVAGRPLSAKKVYYIKRLVGLPGDTLKIKDEKLWVKEKGQSEFVVVDGKFHKSFDRIYSGKGGYHGYCNLASTYLNDENAEYVVPDDHFFMMGDNSRNSLDCRFFGAVPRRNFVGKAMFIWWPLTRRWGMTDTIEPLNNDKGDEDHFKDNFTN